MNMIVKYIVDHETVIVKATYSSHVYLYRSEFLGSFIKNQCERDLGDSIHYSNFTVYYGQEISTQILKYNESVK
jgi:hypothetical protein